MRRLFLSLLLVCVTSARATSFSTDLSDLWYHAPAESQAGWGINVVQQGEILFITLFVYSANTAPTWFVAPATAYTGSGLTFSGPLYTTSGSGFAAPWNPGTSQFRQVGTITFSSTSIATATLSYVVDGQQVNKNLVRQTWRINNLAGSYIGATIGTYSNCTSPTLNGYSEEPATISVTHGSSPVVTIQAVGATNCTLSGEYLQGGRMGFIPNGVYACTNGVTGTFTAFEIEAGISGFTGRATVNSSVCAWSGRFGGLRRN